MREVNKGSGDWGTKVKIGEKGYRDERRKTGRRKD